MSPKPQAAPLPTLRLGRLPKSSAGRLQKQAAVRRLSRSPPARLHGPILSVLRASLARTARRRNQDSQFLSDYCRSNHPERRRASQPQGDAACLPPEVQSAAEQPRSRQEKPARADRFLCRPRVDSQTSGDRPLLSHCSRMAGRLDIRPAEHIHRAAWRDHETTVVVHDTDGRAGL